MRNYGARVQSNLRLGEHPILVMENEKIRLSFLLGRGCDLYEILYKPTDLDLSWMRNDNFPDGRPNANYPSPLGSFMDQYLGGWQVIFPSGGEPTDVDGADFGQHGESALLPWDVTSIEESPEFVKVNVSVKLLKYPFVINRELTLNNKDARFTLKDTDVNLAPVEIDTMYGLHVTFGPKFLTEQSQILIKGKATATPGENERSGPVRRVKDDSPFAWPNAVGPDGKTFDASTMPAYGAPSDIYYLSEMENQTYTVTSPTNNLQATLDWKSPDLKYVWYWQEFGATRGWPWFGMNYNIGLEPFTSNPTFGLAESIKRGTALRFKAHESKVFDFAFSIAPMK